MSDKILLYAKPLFIQKIQECFFDGRGFSRSDVAFFLKFLLFFEHATVSKGVVHCLIKTSNRGSGQGR